MTGSRAQIKMQGIIQSILNVLYPPSCLACGGIPTETNTHQLCQDCDNRFAPLPLPCCAKCAAPVGMYRKAEPRCAACKRLTTHFKRAFAAAEYEGSMKMILQNYKFYGARDAAAVLAPVLAQCINDRIPEESLKALDGFVVVPSHKATIEKRGFQHMERIAVRLKSRIPVPYLADVLRVKILRPPQHEMQTQIERFRNVADNFEVQKASAVRDKNILLIDDVMTTGATAAECSRILLKAGALSVHVSILARTRRD